MAALMLALSGEWREQMMIKISRIITITKFMA
jgi:hypothetical protein